MLLEVYWFQVAKDENCVSAVASTPWRPGGGPVDSLIVSS
jgi:hypothetical protein